MSIFAELKRRHVYRVAVLYVIVSWLVLQVADVFMSFLPLPEWTNNLVFLLLVLGLPVALVFAWAFELTPDGFRREIELGAEQKTAGGTGESNSTASRKKLDILIFSTMVIALSYFAYTHDWQSEPEAVAPVVIRSIVVLPLTNLMNDPEQAFFVEGMHEALITELSKVKALRVISRTSAMHYKDAGKSVPEIARELGVDAIVEGSVLRAGKKVRVTAQLIEGATDRHLWADNFDRELTDILALYAEVTREIVHQIKVTVTPEEEAGLMVTRQVSPEVYELYLKGRYFCDKWTPQDLEQGIDLMQRAISLDTQYAPAYAGLASCLQYSAFFGYVLPLEILPRSKAAALMAVELDQGLAEAHVALAGILYYVEYNVKEAEEELKRALELDPALYRAWIHMSWLLSESGRFDEALEPTRRAVQLDPLSPVAHVAMGEMYYLQRNFDQAIRAYEKGLDLNRNEASTLQFLAWPYEQQGQHAKAIALHQKAVELSQRAPLYLAGLGYSYAIAGQREDALLILEELQQTERPSAYDLALVHLGLGNHERAIDLLEAAFDARNSYILYLGQAAQFDPLRGNERFDRLLKRIE